MGQTLTHGVYLPDEGERNCYSGLAANWGILDGAVGTVAEHTAALAGKAPAVHTHVKSDVTDLFNSANTWSGNNTYSKLVVIERNTDTGSFLALKNSVAELGSTPASATPVTIAYPDKNNENLGYMGMFYDTDGSNRFRLFVRNKFTSGAPSTSGTVDYAYFGLQLNADKSKEGILKASFRPYDNNTHDLGSSSYQWNNLYAKNYYYNGVAWGLDKANEWSKTNKFSVNISPSDITGIDSNTMAFTALRSVIFFNTTGSSNRQSYGTFLYSGYTAGSKPDNYSQLQLLRSTDKKGETNNGLIPDTSFAMWRVAPHYLLMDFMNSVRVTNDGIENSLKPITNNATDLGTSDNKWKTINGVNPGALSLPDTLGASGTENVNYFNVIGYLTNTGTLATIPTTATYDGWLYINAKDGADSYIIVDDSPSSFGTSVFGNNGLGAQSIGLLCLMCPIRKGHSYNVRIKSAGIVSARIYPAQGNV